VFLYAAIVLDDLLPRLDVSVDLAEYPLPADLSAIYREFLLREIGADRELRWTRLFKPFLGSIGVGQGSGLSLTHLKAIVGPEVDLALTALRQFLEHGSEQGPFRLFHKSFADFLFDPDTPGDLKIDTSEAHQAVADGLWKRHASDWLDADPYTLDSLAIHVSAAGDHEKCRALLSQEWMRARVGKLRLDAFGSDVEHLWRTLNQHPNRQKALVAGARCALIRSSINARARNYPTALVVRAAELGVWSADQVIGLQSDATSAAAVELAIAMVRARCLPPERLKDLVARALVVAPHISSDGERVRRMAELAEVVETRYREDLVNQALDSIARMTSTSERMSSLACLLGVARGPQAETIGDQIHWLLEMIAEHPTHGLTIALEELSRLTESSRVLPYWPFVRKLRGAYLAKVALAWIPHLEGPQRSAFRGMARPGEESCACRRGKGTILGTRHRARLVGKAGPSAG
jgi:hypothetical protein